MLKGKTAIVTGGSRGIGRAIALKFAENGADVAVVYAGNSAAAEETCTAAEKYGVKCKAYQCNVADFEATKALTAEVLKDFGRIDILVNNAGVTRDGPVAMMKEQDFDTVVGVSLKGAFNMIRHCSRTFMRQRSGRIISLSSVAGLTGNPGQANYSAAKAGIVGLTKSAAKELAGRGVTCNAIAPGFIDTDMTKAMTDKAREAAVAAIPLKRTGSPEDIAALAAFLADDGASYITGEVIRVDGGLCI